MPSKIVLSYRRSDSDVITGRIRDTLANHYGEDAVFMDIDSIPIGFDYREKIKDALVENKVMIAVIGPKWLGGSGKSARINKDNDPVRIELETAFQQGVPIIPVLVGDATMPETSDLPRSLQRLCDINAAIVDGGRDFHQHMDRLIHGVDQILKTSESTQSEQTPKTDAAAHSEELSSRKWIPIALGAVACLLVTAVGLWAYRWISPYINSTNPEQPIAQTRPATKPLATVATPSPAIAPPAFSSAACNPEKASFYDDFHKTDLGWNITTSDQIHYADGQLVLTPAAAKGRLANYLSLRYENVTICAHIKSPSQVKALDGDAAAGVIFWVSDTDNYYLAQIQPDGSYSIYRKIAPTWVTLIPRTKSDQIKSDPGAINEVAVAIASDFAALFINSAKLQEFRGQSPKGGGAFGVYAQSEKTAPNEWRFLDIAVMDNGKSKPVPLPLAPSGPSIGDCQPIKTTDFQDRFQKPDPGWAIADPTISYVDGQLAVKLDRGHNRALLYRPLIFRNATVCVTVKSPPAVSNLDDTLAGGLAFWAAVDYQTFYVAQIYPNGTFAVYRRVEGNWATVIPRTMSDTIKKGIGAVNELQVVLNDGKGLLYINGMQVGEFRGQLPSQNGGAMGIFAQSGAQEASDWRFLNIAVVENQ